MSKSIKIIDMKIISLREYSFISFNLFKKYNFSLFCEPYLKTLDIIGIKCFIFLTLLSLIDKSRPLKYWDGVTSRLVSEIDEKVHEKDKKRKNSRL